RAVTDPTTVGAAPGVEVSVVIPNLDGGALLRAAVDTLLATPGPALEVVVVDNGSRDGSADEAAARDTRVRVVRNDRNLGFAPACNQGASAATGRLLLFLNNDARITGRALDVLVASLDDGRLWAVQPVMVREHEDGMLDSAGSQFTWTGFLRHNTSVPPGSGPVPIFAAKGACLLVRADRFRQVGGFHDPFFAYFEDSDLCWRLRLAGGDVALVPGVTVFHDTGGTTRRFFHPADIDFLSFRNRLWSILSNCEPSTLAVVLPLHVLACLSTAAVFLVRRNTASARAIARAVVWPALHPGAVRSGRRQVRAVRTRRDREVLGPDVRAPMRPRDALHLLRSYVPRWEAP
ncbi:MAG: glycosyltransferase family 2 protein, partial [Actinomycetes bacterium]